MAPTPTAARPPASLVALDRPGNLTPVRFTPGSSEVAPEAQSELDAVASRLRADPDLRLELRAYARASKEASESRRLSLKRAIGVRAYLIARGVSSSRMLVQALGDQLPGPGDPDRVDLVLLGH